MAESLTKRFKELVQSHDLTHSYSDDPSCWRRGRDQLEEIRKLASKLPAPMVEEIWNKMVDERLAEFARADFYWKG